VVLFPAPLGPTQPSTSPASNRRDTSCTAGSAPYRFTKFRASSTAGSFVSCTAGVISNAPITNFYCLKTNLPSILFFALVPVNHGYHSCWPLLIITSPHHLRASAIRNLPPEPLQTHIK